LSEKDDPFHLLCQHFSDTELFDDHHGTDRAQTVAGQMNLPQGFQLAIVGKERSP
jgi:hypothetical protein